MTAPRLTRSGAWRPWAVDYMDGVREQERLRGEGVRLDLDSHELAALGRAMAEQREAQAEPVAQAKDLVLTEEQRQALDQLAAKRAAMPEEWEWHNWAARHRGHRHVANETCTEDGPGPDAAQDALSTTPEESGIGDRSGKGYGRGGSTTREQSKESESDERRKRYWADLTRDRPEDEWRPQ